MATQVALIFPGQGAQKVGMGKEFYDASPAAREIFDQADTILGLDLKNVIFNGPVEKLTATAHAQPAILTFSIAALKAFEAHPKFKNIVPKFSAGLSLGEYSALVAAGALSFKDALRLLERRAFFMEEACRIQLGIMAAVIGFNKDRLKQICLDTGAQVANFNSPEQIVITGNTAKVEAACEILKKEGARSVIPLDVSGAFHSTLMRPAALRFEEELKKCSIYISKFPVVTNVSATPQESPQTIRLNLARQITSAVQWEDSVRFIAQEGISNFIEIGPGKVLKGLIRKIDPNLKVFNVETPSDIEALLF